MDTYARTHARTHTHTHTHTQAPPQFTLPAIEFLSHVTLIPNIIASRDICLQYTHQW